MLLKHIKRYAFFVVL